MIKLIVCDLDGTLLPRGQSRISNEIGELIKEAEKKNISFAVASGRAYHELKRLFEGISKNIIYLPSDGSLIVWQEQTYYNKPLKKFTVEAMVNPITNADNLSVVLSGKYMSYVFSKDKEFTENFRKSVYNHAMEIKNLTEINEDIYKISFYGKPGSVFTKKIISGTYTNMSELIYNDNNWAEFIAAGGGKAPALHCMTKSRKLSAEEFAVIGDDINDVGMLGLTENSYAVQGGHIKALKAAKNATLDVTATLKNIIRKGEI